MEICWGYNSLKFRTSVKFDKNEIKNKLNYLVFNIF